MNCVILHLLSEVNYKMEVRALIYSENRFFVDSFSAYIMSHHVDGVELAFFSDRVSAQNYLGQQRVEMILQIAISWKIRRFRLKLSGYVYRTGRG